MAATNIAQEITRLTTAKADIKTAIEGKGVTVPSSTLLDGYAALVDQIQQGGGAEEAPENDVNFYDYDGFRVASYTIEEAKALTELPTPPSHEGLTFQEWNWSLADIQGYDRQYADIGANYITTDGNTHLKVKVQAGETISIQLTMDSGCSVVVDYGDGEQSPSTTGTGKGFYHTYITAGLYDIKIIPSGTALFGFVNAHVWVGSFYEINIGANFALKNISNFQYRNCILSIPTSIDLSVPDFRFSSVPVVVVPRGLWNFSNTNAFRNLNGKISFPKQVASLSGSGLIIISTFTRLVLPEYTTGSMTVNAFQTNYWLITLSLPMSMQWAGSGAFFSNDNSLCELDIVQGWIPNYSLVLSASNMWSAFNMVNFFNKLGTTQTAITLTFGSTNLAKLTEEQKAIATDKGYTLA